MDYVLCSSSSEEGEVKCIEDKEYLPIYPSYNNSFLKYFFYQGRYIGKNTILTRDDISYTDSNMINSSYVINKFKKTQQGNYIYQIYRVKTDLKCNVFFSNKFHKIGSITPKETNYKFITEKGELKELQFPLRHSNPRKYNKYEAVINNIVSNPDNSDYDSVKPVLLIIKDSILNKLESSIVNFKVIENQGNKIIIFIDFYKSKYGYKDLLEDYVEFIVNIEADTNFYRRYEMGDKDLIIYSPGQFLNDGEAKNIYTEIEGRSDKVDIIVEHDGLRMFEDSIPKNMITSLNLINGIEVKPGNYIIKDGDIYEITNDENGLIIKFEGLTLEGFVD
ncbi:hypothetical protein TCON_1672 [Astathelohania contejeani]|uniref:Uncharacterized protein n=1 Tax=Astathelohania contejeani TaxID=164912 RepID=A0ABQ7HY77_9MICR|nr:hypothetical protein TCON_1672 [Thelohania contejeani]